MIDFDDDLRTIPATPRRRLLARQAGSVPRSAAAVSASVCIGCLVGFVCFGPSLWHAVRRMVTESLTRPEFGDPALIGPLIGERAMSLAQPLAGWLLSAAVCAVAAHLLQFGFLIAWPAVQPDARRISPTRGLHRMAAGLSAGDIGLFAVQVAVVGGVVGWFVWTRSTVFMAMVFSPINVSGPLIAVEAARFALSLLGACGLLAVLDVVRQRLRHEQRLRTTPQEAREEQRLSDADPAVQAQRRDRHRELAGVLSSSKS